ncbi:unnamed protein product [Rotaria sordida]|uniref:Uncharacterized protein n=1 Tax=Rotaria sordida TaxID=392033 RepID=A0A814TDR7_9BILA|nr:unnamed protein product [Rotaria sordida]CAF1407508.1 unnamed protein product [Rotaria sordida]
MYCVGEQRDYLHKNLTENSVSHSFLSCIKDWEKTSIRKIQEVAEKPKSDLALYMNETKSQIKQSLNNIKNELELSRKLDNYTGIEWTEWMEQLEELRQMFEKSSTIDIVEDNPSQPFIRVIRRKNFETKKKSKTAITSALLKTDYNIGDTSYTTRELLTRLNTMTKSNKKPVNQQFAAPGVHKQLL